MFVCLVSTRSGRLSTSCRQAGWLAGWLSGHRVCVGVCVVCVSTRACWPHPQCAMCNVRCALTLSSAVPSHARRVIGSGAWTQVWMERCTANHTDRRTNGRRHGTQATRARLQQGRGAPVPAVPVRRACIPRGSSQAGLHPRNTHLHATAQSDAHALILVPHTHSYLSRTAGSCSGSAHTVHASSQCAVCARHDLRHFATPL